MHAIFTAGFVKWAQLLSKFGFLWCLLFPPVPLKAKLFGSAIFKQLYFFVEYVSPSTCQITPFNMGQCSAFRKLDETCNWEVPKFLYKHVPDNFLFFFSMEHLFFCRICQVTLIYFSQEDCYYLNVNLVFHKFISRQTSSIAER